MLYPQYNNAKVEASNRTIQKIKNNGRGYKNFYNLRTRLFMRFNYLNNINTVTRQNYKVKKKDLYNNENTQIRAG